MLVRSHPPSCLVSRKLTASSQTTFHPTEPRNRKVCCGRARSQLWPLADDVGRANSAQSLRIRSLEGEIARLLSENVFLREHIIRLEAQASQRASRHVLEEVDGIKGRLEERLAQLGGLVAELGGLRDLKQADAQSPVASCLAVPSPRRSPHEKNWKNTMTVSEVTSNLDGRLPPIVEDKYYPRRTQRYVDDLMSRIQSLAERSQCR